LLLGLTSRDVHRFGRNAVAERSEGHLDPAEHDFVAVVQRLRRTDPRSGDECPVRAAEVGEGGVGAGARFPSSSFSTASRFIRIATSAAFAASASRRRSPLSTA